ncbi:MAG: redox-regulated ATPase YchF [Nanoarchaeota archaeon]|nr:redox-regulated ATPase YchF [Nanoarchaeota archaeon]
MLIGVVGKPSAGKSTFFKASTLADVEIANYPFTTIKPNHAIGFVRIDCVDTFFKTQCTPRTGSCVHHQRFVPVELLDVAGLVPDAHKGEGLGLQFLNDLNQADALLHVVDASGATDAKGNEVEAGTHDPLGDIRFLEHELDHWYLTILNRGWDKLTRAAQATHEDAFKVIAKQLSGLGVSEDIAKDAMKTCKLTKALTQWTEEDLFSLARTLRKRTKPMLIVANKVDKPHAAENVARMKETFPQLLIVPCSSEAELALKEAAKHGLIEYLSGDDHYEPKEEMTAEQQKALAFVKKTVLDPFKGTGVQQALNMAVFDLLKYKAVFPGGVNNLKDSEGRTLPDCFLLPEKATALDFAYRVHTDFGKNFIKAIDVKKKMPIGKDIVLKHRDVIEIMARA